jgi:hypothetical protein
MLFQDTLQNHDIMQLSLHPLVQNIPIRLGNVTNGPNLLIVELDYH